MSKDPEIQKLMAEAEALDSGDQSLEAKLNQIAQAVAARQAGLRPAAATNQDGPVDPADAFACEGCQ